MGRDGGCVHGAVYGTDSKCMFFPCYVLGGCDWPLSWAHACGLPYIGMAVAPNVFYSSRTCGLRRGILAAKFARGRWWGRNDWRI
jgi:hypothetical protein